MTTCFKLFGLGIGEWPHAGCDGIIYFKRNRRPAGYRHQSGAHQEHAFAFRLPGALANFTVDLFVLPSGEFLFLYSLHPCSLLP